MTKNKIVIFISIVIAGCLALGAWAYYSAGTMSRGYKDVSKMDWSLKLSDKYISISSSPVDGEFYFHAKDSSVEDKGGVMDYKGKVILPPAFSISAAGDGWYSVMDEYGAYTYKNTKGILLEEWTYTTSLHFWGDYAIVARSDGQQMVMNKKGKIVRKLKTKNSAMAISKNCYSVYDKKTKRLQLLDMKTDEVIFESTKYRYISDLYGDGYMAMLQGTPGKQVVLGKDFEPLFDGKKFRQPLGYGHGLLLVMDERQKGYFDVKNNRVAINLPGDVISAYPFSEGLAIVYTETRVFAMDTTGKVIFEKPFDGRTLNYGGVGGSVFSGGIAPLAKDINHWGYVDKTGEYVVKPIFNEVSEVNGGYAAVRLDEKWGILCL